MIIVGDDRGGDCGSGDPCGDVRIFVAVPAATTPASATVPSATVAAKMASPKMTSPMAASATGVTAAMTGEMASWMTTAMPRRRGAAKS